MCSAKNEDVTHAAQILTEAGIEYARFEAQLLLAMTLGITRVSVVAQTYEAPDATQRAQFEVLVRQRAQRVPLAYLRGYQEFYGREFKVTPAVLVPRPETELLVEKILALITDSPDLQAQSQIQLADVGTGTGCIPVSILGELAKVRALAFDLSGDALAVAQQNARRHGVEERIRFVQGDLLTGARSGRFDIIVSNPPYIPGGEIDLLQKEVSLYEPRLALDGGVDGLQIYKRLIGQSRQSLAASGWLYLEIGQGQADAVTRLAQAAGFAHIRVTRDLASIARVVEGQKS